METKYTKGNWRVSDITLHGETLVYGEDNYLICDCSRIPKRTNIEAEANAKLIAAAPDLLETINDFYQLICEGHVKVYAEEGINIQKYYSQIEKAIKKATE